MMNWITVAAQIVNFLILVWLLKRFLYGPIVRAMDKREKTIRQRLEGADEKRVEAEQKAEEFDQRQRELEEQREDELKKAREQAQQEKKKLLDAARKEADEKRERWAQDLEREQQNFVADARRTVGEQVVQVARKALGDMADADLEQQLVAAFLKQLEALDGEQRKEIREALDRQEGPVTLRSSFELAAKDRDRAAKKLSELFERDVEVETETSADLLCGLEATAAGHKVGWTLSRYLEQTERELNEMFRGAVQEQKADGEAKREDEAAEEESDEEEQDDETSGDDGDGAAEDRKGS